MIKKTLLSFTLLFSSIIFIISCKNEKNDFYRYDLSKNLKIFHSVKFVAKTPKNYPVNSGYEFLLNGKKRIKLKNIYEGKSGILIHMNFKSTRPIEFELYKSGKKRQRLHYIKTDNFNSEIIEQFHCKQDEEIVLKFKGTGKIFISNPIIYKIKENKRKNYVFIIAVDTLRQDMIAKIVNGKSITPNIDKFKNDAVSFNNCFAPSSWTLPSFTSFFTSLNEFNHNVGIKTVLKKKIKSLIENLSTKYITIGYHGGIVLSKRWGHSRGFDLYKEFNFAGLLYPYGGRSLFEKAIETIDRGAFPNLLLFLHTYQIHDPYTPPKEYLNKINKNPVKDRADTVNSSKPERTFLKTDETTKKSLMELYQAEILAFDSFFGKFIKELKDKGLYKSSTIILMSDHGEEFFEHGGWAHSHSLYQEIINVPFIIKFPNNKFGRQDIEKPVSTIDILPTLCDFDKVNIDHKKIDGLSLMRIIENPNISRGKPIISAMTGSRYIEAISKKFAIVIDKTKLIYNYKMEKKGLEFFEKYGLPPKVDKIEVYNLERDPKETNSIYKNNQKIQKKIRLLIKKIKKIIENNKSNGQNKKLDKDVENQLKTIGYI